MFGYFELTAFLLEDSFFKKIVKCVPIEQSSLLNWLFNIKLEISESNSLYSQIGIKKEKRKL